MNIIFLDIDRVLNHQISGKTEEDKWGFSQQLVDNLKFILYSVPNTRIVISSSWKLIREFPWDHENRDLSWRDVLKDKLGYDVIIGETPNVNEYPKIDLNDIESVPGKGRGDDIALWIKENSSRVNLENYVILDDNVSCGNIPKMFPNNFVNCDKYEPYEGLSLRHAKEAIWILQNFGKDKNMTENTFFTSDTHFFHDNIIKYCNRPWNDSISMNEAIVERWNSVIGKDDIVWHLGDFCFGKKENIYDIFPKLNGKINLVMGNHDHQKLEFYYDVGFNRVYDRPVIINNFFILSHAPLEWIQNPMYNIFGHVHNNELYKTWSNRGCCVCVERHEYKPISWKEINDHLENP